MTERPKVVELFPAKELPVDFDHYDADDIERLLGIWHMTTQLTFREVEFLMAVVRQWMASDHAPKNKTFLIGLYSKLALAALSIADATGMVDDDEEWTDDDDEEGTDDDDD